MSYNLKLRKDPIVRKTRTAFTNKSVLTSIDVAGELIRKNVVEDQQGVPLYLDIQLVDTNTCNPMPNIYTDIWHCNATVSAPACF